VFAQSCFINSDTYSFAAKPYIKSLKDPPILKLFEDTRLHETEAPNSGAAPHGEGPHQIRLSGGPGMFLFEKQW